MEKTPLRQQRCDNFHLSNQRYQRWVPVTIEKHCTITRAFFALHVWTLHKYFKEGNDKSWTMPGEGMKHRHLNDWNRRWGIYGQLIIFWPIYEEPQPFKCTMPAFYRVISYCRSQAINFCTFQFRFQFPLATKQLCVIEFRRSDDLNPSIFWAEDDSAIRDLKTADRHSARIYGAHKIIITTSLLRWAIVTMERCALNNLTNNQSKTH